MVLPNGSCRAQFTDSQFAGDRWYLRRDAQLRAKLSVEGLDPPVQEVIDRLCDATQLNLTLDRSLRYHSPTLGSMQLRDAPAFAVMEVLAERQIEDGYWEKTKDGYRLTGKSLSLRPPATALTPGRLAALGGGGALIAVVAAGAVWYVRRRPAVGGPVAPEPPKTDDTSARARRVGGP